MRFLLDEDVDVRLSRVLRKLGHEVKRVPTGAINGTVIRLARTEHRVLITRDSDFANVLLYPPSRYEGIIHLAIHPPWLEKIVPPLTRLLTVVPEQGFAGKTLTLTETGYHQIP